MEQLAEHRVDAQEIVTVDPVVAAPAAG